MLKDLLAAFALFAADSASSRMTWGGLYQPAKPKSLEKRK